MLDTRGIVVHTCGVGCIVWRARFGTAGIGHTYGFLHARHCDGYVLAEHGLVFCEIKQHLAGSQLARIQTPVCLRKLSPGKVQVEARDVGEIVACLCHIEPRDVVALTLDGVARNNNCHVPAEHSLVFCEIKQHLAGSQLARIQTPVCLRKLSPGKVQVEARDVGEIVTRLCHIEPRDVVALTLIPFCRGVEYVGTIGLIDSHLVGTI